MSIKDNLLKIKPLFNKNTIYGFILIFVAITAFGLGKISEKREKRTPIILGSFETSQISNISTITTSKDVIETVVASKNGKNYYFSSCAGAKRIKEENKIFFKSEKEAENSGYKLAQNCHSLNK